MSLKLWANCVGTFIGKWLYSMVVEDNGLSDAAHTQAAKD
jgi:hypothetical protein